MASLVEAVRRIKHDPTSLIDPDLAASICALGCRPGRERVLTPVRTLELFAQQIALGNIAIAELVHRSGGEFTESAYCQARQRVPVQVLQDLLTATTAKLLGPARQATGTWNGHRTFTTDGTGIDMPEEADLQLHFGQPSDPGAGLGFPVAHVLPLFDAASGLILNLTISPYATPDITKVSQVSSSLKEGDILLSDRGISSYPHVAMLAARGVHVLCRCHKGRKIPYPASIGPRPRNSSNRHARHTPILIQLLGDQDQIVELHKPRTCPAWMKSQEFAAIASTLEVRVLKFKVHERGFRTREIELMTTLKDPVKYPAQDLAELYMARWQVEVNLRHLKQTLGMTSLHCKTVEGVKREMLMFVLIYNTVCAVMVTAAQQQDVAPQRISFRDALRWIIHGRAADGPIPTLKVNPKRHGRLYDRATKQRRPFPKLTVTRAAYRKKYEPPPPN